MTSFDRFYTCLTERLPETITFFRLRIRLSKKELAKRAGVSFDRWSQYESGDHSLNGDEIATVERVLELREGQLLGYTLRFLVVDEQLGADDEIPDPDNLSAELAVLETEMGALIERIRDFQKRFTDLHERWRLRASLERMAEPVEA